MMDGAQDGRSLGIIARYGISNPGCCTGCNAVLGVENREFRCQGAETVGESINRREDPLVECVGPCRSRDERARYGGVPEEPRGGITKRDYVDPFAVGYQRFGQFERVDDASSRFG